jgi:hypothetical protein
MDAGHFVRSAASLDGIFKEMFFLRFFELDKAFGMWIYLVHRMHHVATPSA